MSIESPPEYDESPSSPLLTNAHEQTPPTSTRETITTRTTATQPSPNPISPYANLYLPTSQAPTDPYAFHETQWSPNGRQSTISGQKSPQQQNPQPNYEFDDLKAGTKETPPQYSPQSQPNSTMTTATINNIPSSQPTQHPSQAQDQTQQQKPQQRTSTTEITFPILKPKPIPGLIEYQLAHAQQQQQVTPQNLQGEGHQQLPQQSPQEHRPRTQPNQKALCGTCQHPYALPAGATSWRCKKCGNFQNLGPRDCSIM